MLIDQFKEIKDFAFLPERALVSFRILWKYEVNTI